MKLVLNIQQVTITNYYNNVEANKEITTCPHEVIIPKEIGELPVTTIGFGSFQSNQITSVTIKGKSSTDEFINYQSQVFGWASGKSDEDIIFLN